MALLKNCNRGGAMPGAGRKPRWGEKTCVLQVRVPESVLAEIDRQAQVRGSDRAEVVVQHFRRHRWPPNLA